MGVDCWLFVYVFEIIVVLWLFFFVYCSPIFGAFFLFETMYIEELKEEGELQSGEEGNSNDYHNS